MDLEQRSPYDDQDRTESVDERDDVDEVDGGHLAGLRAVGLPVVDRRAADRAGRRPSAELAELVEQSWAESTRGAYSADWQLFTTWCSVHGLDDPYQADELDLGEWIASMTLRRLALATIKRRVAAVNWWFEVGQRRSPTKGPGVRLALSGAARTLGTGQRRAAPLRLEQLRRLVVGLPIVTGHPAAKTPRIRRDQVMFLVVWAAALRSEELVGLDVEDLTFSGDADAATEGGMLVRMRTSKGSQTEPVHVAVPYSTHLSACPVRLAMLHARQVRSGPLFRRIDRHGRSLARLGSAAVSRVLKDRIATVLAESPDIYSSHSLRAGFVTEARARRVPDALIARHTRHRDLNMLQVYDRPADLFNDPALAGEWW